MIPRYSRKDMITLWSDDSRFAIWLAAELAHLRAREARDLAPHGTADRIENAARNNPLSAQRILEIEKVCKHDVIAFLTHVEEVAAPDARFLHVGLTSSDIWILR